MFHIYSHCKMVNDKQQWCSNLQWTLEGIVQSWISSLGSQSLGSLLFSKSGKIAWSWQKANVCLQRVQELSLLRSKHTSVRMLSSVIRGPGIKSRHIH